MKFNDYAVIVQENFFFASANIKRNIFCLGLLQFQWNVTRIKFCIQQNLDFETECNFCMNSFSLSSSLISIKFLTHKYTFQ